MVNTIVPVYSQSSYVDPATKKGGNTSFTQEDFTKLLLAQMAQPNINSLFSNDNSATQGSSSYMNSAASSPISSLSSYLSPQTSNSDSQISQLAQLFMGSGDMKPAMALSMYSNFIGKEIDAVDQTTGEKVSGKVQSVVLQDGVAMLDIGSALLEPSSVVKVK